MSEGLRGASGNGALVPRADRLPNCTRIVARSLANDPLLILADEPTGNLDSRTGKEVLDMIDDLNAHGKTIVLVTHDDKVAARAHRVLHMQDGLIEREVVNQRGAQGGAVLNELNR